MVMSKLDYEQILRDCYDPTNTAMRVKMVTSTATTTNTRSKLDFQQCYRLAYDETSNALKLVRVNT